MIENDLQSPAGVYSSEQSGHWAIEGTSVKEIKGWGVQLERAPIGKRRKGNRLGNITSNTVPVDTGPLSH